MSGLYQSFDVSSDAHLDRVIALAMNEWQPRISFYVSMAGWLVFWDSNEPSCAVDLPASLGPAEVSSLASAWLLGLSRHQMPARPDVDGSVEPGFRVVSGSSLNSIRDVPEATWAVLAVSPAWIVYGK